MPSVVFRPPRYAYDLRAILDLPIRLLNPPPAPCKSKTFQIAPDYKIELDDILDNKHLPPMALKDFEEYLLFTEYSPENLYFIMWLREYTSAYESAGKGTSEGQLAIRFSRALSTFFDATSNLALNLPATSTASITSQPSSHPPPSAFEDVQIQVRGMLKDSLARFVRRSFGNAGKNRTWASAGLGLSFILVGLIPTIVTTLLDKSRWIRLAGFILWWTGCAAFIAASNGLCLILYAFGDARQLYAYELSAPKIPASIVPPTSSTLFNEDEEKKIGLPASPSVFDDYDSSKSINLTASFIEPPPSYMTIAPTPNTATLFTFDFDSLPPTPKSKGYTSEDDSSVADSIPTFGSITRIPNPLIRRSHWDIASKCLAIGFVFAIICSAVCVVLPSRHRH